MDQTNSETKRHKISDGESFPVDRISNLPDFVLSHILSFLPSTKESVKTSILSKRWRNVWTSVNKLKLDSMYLYAKTKKRLPRFVYKFLKVYQGNIKEFTLSGHDLRCTEFDVTSWINTAVSRGVERLKMDISFPDGTPNWPPLSIFTCKTLVDLEIWSLDGKTMDIPTTPIFPCLKKLKNLYANSGFFENIVARCPALEHLIVGLSGARSRTPIDIVSPSVKRLELDFSGDDQKIVLRAPSLQYLNLCCVLPFEFIVQEQLSALIEADIFFREYPSLSRNVTVKQIRESFERFIQIMSNVKSLRIRFYGSKFFDSIGHGLFVNLTKLKIVSSYFEWKLLLCFMESSINLEAITLRKNSKLKKHKLAWKDPKKVPTCLSSSLKNISIDGYSEEELPMVTYVLRTAQVLEQVKITCAMCYRDKNDLKLDMLQTMQKLPRASVGCEISLV